MASEVPSSVFSPCVFSQSSVSLMVYCYPLVDDVIPSLYEKEGISSHVKLATV